MKCYFGLLLSIFCLFAACDNSADKLSAYLDKPRLRAEAIDSIRPWLEHAPDGSGFFRTNFDRNWHPRDGNNKVSLVGLTRLLYIFAAGYDLTGDAQYLETVRLGARFLLNNMRNLKNGGWFKVVNSQGEPSSSSVHPYGYSFVIFGLSHAYRVTGEDEFLDAALDTWQSGAWRGLLAARSIINRGYIDLENVDSGVVPVWQL